jgi:hypothetical protein
VLEALTRLTRENMGFYPPYSAVTDAAARYFGIAADPVALVNGLDEGIMGAAIAYLRPSAGSGLVPEAVVPEPAFEIFRFDTAVAGGRLVQVMPRPDFAFALDEVLAAITPETRILVLNTAAGWVGAIVDTVHEVAVVPADSVSPPPPLFRGLAAEFIRGVAKVRDQLVVVLDVDRVVSSADRIVLEHAVSASRGAGAGAKLGA